MDEIEARKLELKQKEEERKALADKVAGGMGTTVEKNGEEEKMSNKEVRNSQAYIDAYANYIKSGDAEECRSLLSENGGGGVPVPEFVEDVIRTAWDDEPIMSLITRTAIKGNLKIGFEISASDAVVHKEGGAAVTEEELSMGIVTMVPETVKKWVSVSDEVLDLDSGAFITYIYDEIAHKIAAKISQLVVADILAGTDAGTATAPAVKNVASGKATTAQIIDAMQYLADEARNPVVIMSKATKAAIQSAVLSAGYGYDPFNGLACLTSSAADGHIIVGDLNGYRLNFPNGEAPAFKLDDLTLATSDLVRIIGRLPVAHAVVAPGYFVDVTLGA